MATLVIAGIYDLADKIAQHHPDLVISITDPDADEVDRAAKALAGYDGPVVKLAFHDIATTGAGATLPTPAHLEAVSKRLAEHLPSGDGTILVHCAAGISRSPAIGLYALGWAAQRRAPREVSTQEISKIWKAAVGDCEPNRRILAMLPMALGSVGRLLAEMAIDHTQTSMLAARRKGSGSIF
jgi:predicted protein tyrosine phosphatase